MVLTASGTGTARADPRAEDVFRLYRDRVLQVRVIERVSREKSTLGSGFMVQSGGLAITNYHVVSDLVWRPQEYRGEVLLDNGESRELTLLDIDVVHDLALIRLKGQLPPSLGVARDLPPKGARLFALGNPYDLGQTVVEGTFSGEIEQSLVHRLHFTGSLNPGMSGGPVLNGGGEVVGVSVASKGEQVSFLVPAVFVHKLLSRHAPASSAAELQSRLRAQLAAHQDSITRSLTSKPLRRTEMGTLLVPGRPSRAFRCWAKNDGPHGRYSEVLASCLTADAIFVNDELTVGQIGFLHHVMTRRAVNAWQFAALQTKRLATNGLMAPPDAGGSDDDRRAWTTPRCAGGFVQAGSVPMRAQLCVQGYARLPGLYFVEWRAGSQIEGRAGLTTVLQMSGVTLSAAKRLLAHYIGSFGWHR